MILPIEKQVCDLKYANRLNELGLKQDSVWWWVIGKCDKKVYIITEPEKDTMLKLDKPVKMKDYTHHYIQEIKSKYSAFTVAELGEIFGQYFNEEEFIEVNYGKCFTSHKDYWCEYINHNKPKEHTIYANTLSNAMAKMMIYLLENKLREKIKKGK